MGEQASSAENTFLGWQHMALYKTFICVFDLIYTKDMRGCRVEAREGDTWRHERVPPTQVPDRVVALPPEASFLRSLM